LATAFANSSDDVPKHFCHCNKEGGGGGEGGFPVTNSSCDVCVDVTVSFLQLKSPNIKMKLDVMINFFIVFVFGGDYNKKMKS
jgi:hypothetical protein